LRQLDRSGGGELFRQPVTEEDVVPQNKRARGAADEVASDDEGLRQAGGLGLYRIRQRHAPLAAVAEQVLERRILPAFDFTGRRNTPWLAGGTVLSEVSDYYVDWYFNGAESGDTIKFLSSTVSFSEANQNNRFEAGNDPGWLVLGTTLGSGLNSPIPFTLTDTTLSMGITNGANQLPNAGLGSLIFSYANPVYWKDTLVGWTLSLDATDWFAFAFNDPGSGDKDFDDFVGIGHLRVAEVPPTPTPLPGALPLMGSVLGGGYLMRKWRARRRRRTGAALAA
jgi:hypothetical protein